MKNILQLTIAFLLTGLVFQGCDSLNVVKSGKNDEWKKNLEIGNKCLIDGKLPQAEEQFKKALETTKDAFTDQSSEYATCANFLAVTYMREGKAPLAVPLFEQALKIEELVAGPEHAQVAEILKQLGECYRQLGETEKAVETYERLIPIQTKIFGATSAQVDDTTGDLRTLKRELRRKKK